MPDSAEYDELRMVLDELNHLGTPDAVAQRLARLEFCGICRLIEHLCL
jgi:hypothetical protein